MGGNCSLEIVCQEAADFLRDLYDEGFFQSEAQFEARLQEVDAEILYGATEGIAREHKLPKRLGGNWTQTPSELAFGVGERGGMHANVSLGTTRKSSSYAIFVL